MFIERLTLSNFRCFGPAPHTIHLSQGLTAFVGANGCGKTAVMQALQRLFGVTGEQRRVRRQDFHVPNAEDSSPGHKRFFIEAIIAFPELDSPTGDHAAIPEFFHQMAADETGRLKCRLRFEASWTDDGSLDGAFEQHFGAIRTFGDFNDEDCIEIKPFDRTRIQLVYVPAIRDGASQVAAFLRGRLWRAAQWSERVKEAFSEAGRQLSDAFGAESAVARVTQAVTARWQEVFNAGTDTKPKFRPLDLRFQEFIRKVEVVFHPDKAGRERPLDDLSDGQRSLFHLAMTAATLDIEGYIAANPVTTGFQDDGVPLPALTLIAIEEPENNLAPFYLSRIIRQTESLASGNRAQALVSSHSASILARVNPANVRHFRLDPSTRTARVQAIQLPRDDMEASKFIREAVYSYPELYFARFVVLGEGASEEIVLPRLAEAIDFPIDRSFVAVVPLGGRHVNHLWRLLNDLEIPHVTLLDLDWGRAGGGWGRIKTTCEQLLKNGIAPHVLFGDQLSPEGSTANLAAFDSASLEDFKYLTEWVNYLRHFGIFFCTPLDLDYSMLHAFHEAYMVAEPGRRGPSDVGDPRIAVLGDDGVHALYGEHEDLWLRWYRYLFLGRGKPSTHVRVLSQLEPETLAKDMPEELRELLSVIIKRLEPARVIKA